MTKFLVTKHIIKYKNKHKFVEANIITLHHVKET